jgi:CheY-like chemotaxis protein
MISTMNGQEPQRQIILVLDDIEETRYLIQRMLKVNGYNVVLARNEEEAISEALIRSPSLILMSLGLEPEQLLAIARRIRQEAALSDDVAIVMLCVFTIPEGAELEVHKNVYMTHPDNFDQLRGFLHRVLHNERSTR